jgi:hypothetical protein
MHTHELGDRWLQVVLSARRLDTLAASLGTHIDQSIRVLLGARRRGLDPIYTCDEIHPTDIEEFIPPTESCCLLYVCGGKSSLTPPVPERGR